MNDAVADLIERPADADEVAERFADRYIFSQPAMTPAALLANSSVYAARLKEIPPRPGFEKVPHTVYFYYVRIDTDGKLRVTHYTYRPGGPIAHNSIRTVVQHLVDNVRGSNDNPAPDPDANFLHIEWTSKSYVAFFIDEENWSLHKNGDPLDGVRFITSLPNTTPNHTFFDGEDLLIRVVNKKTSAVSFRSAIAFVNHMKRDEPGNDLLPGDRQRFKFEIIFDVAFADPAPTRMTVIFDPDGTNVGPPLPPPF